jgi:hypothetical protein
VVDDQSIHACCMRRRRKASTHDPCRSSIVSCPNSHSPQPELAEVGVLLHEGQAQDAQEEADGGTQEHEGHEPPDGGSNDLWDSA